MTIIEKLLLAASVVAALVTIGTAAHKYLYKPFRAWLDDFRKIKEYQHADYLCTLRLTIMSEEMPLEERIAAGDKYIAEGGNGAVKHKYEQLLTQLDKEDA